jgi:hypothetical protein
LFLSVEATDSLTGPWTTLASSVGGAPFSGPGYVSGDAATLGIKLVEIKDTASQPNATRRFLRIRIAR